MKKGTIGKIILLLVLILLVVFIIIKTDPYNLFINRKALAKYIESFGPLSVVIFIALQAVQVLVAPIPGEVSGFIGGYLYGPVWGTLYSTIGLTIGSMVAFFLGRLLGKPFVEKIVNPSARQKYESFLQHRGTPFIFILFLIPGFPKDTLSYLIGLTAMKAKTFLVICTIGRLMGTVLLSMSGNFAKNGRNGCLATVLAIGIAISLLALYYHDDILNLLRRKNPPKSKP